MDSGPIASAAPSIIAGLVLAFVLARAAFLDRERALALWAIAVTAYVIRAAVETLQPFGGATPDLAITTALGIASALLLLGGVVRFTGATLPSRPLVVVAVSALMATLLLDRVGAPFIAVMAPSFVLQGAARIAAGVIWLRRRRGGAWATFVAVLLIAWGLHAFDYLIIASDPRLAWIGYDIAALLADLVAVGIVLAYFDEMRARLSVSEARYRSLFRDSASVMLLIDPADGSIKDANDAAERFYGWSRGELTRMRISEINTLTPEEVKAEMARAKARSKNHFAFRHRLASGEVRDVDVYSGPVPGDAGQTWLYSIVHDVTDRVRAERALAESEQRYRTIIEANALPMMLVDTEEACIVDANEAAARLYGRPVTELETLTVADLSVEGDLDVVLTEVHKTIHAGMRVGAYRHRTAAGDVIDVEVYATPIEVEGRTLLFTVVLDVTARREAERTLARHQASLEDEVRRRTAELTEAYDQLERANRAKDDFLRSMSHELRTPLNSVIGFARLLADELPGPLNAEQKKQVRMIHEAGMHLLSLVDDVLDLARIEDGRVGIELVEVDLAAIAREVAEATRPGAVERGLTLEIETPDAVRCMTDARAVRQILWNILGNAVKYTEEGTVRVTVVPDEDAVRLAVSDTGPGMTPEQVSHAFDAFTRFRPPGDSSGTGLGLAIAKRLAELLGGRLLVVSEPGLGSTFTLELPH